MATVKTREATRQRPSTSEPHKIDRETLLKGLDYLTPALSSSKDIPALRHIWFDGKFACAFDSSFGIRVPLPMDFMGGVQGAALLGLLRTTSAKEVQLEVRDTKHDSALEFRAGRSKAVLPVLDIDQNPWPYAASSKKSDLSIDLTEEFIDGLKRVRVIQSDDVSRMEYYGVTLFPTRDDVELYTTDGRSLAQVIVKQKLSQDLDKVVLPFPFVEQVAKYGKPGGAIEFSGGAIVTDLQGVLVCANLLDSSGVPDMPAVVREALEGVNGTVNLPKDFSEAMSRAAVLVGEQKKPFINIEVDGKELKLTGSYGLGSLAEQLPLGKQKHSAGSIEVGLKAIMELASKAEEFAIKNNLLILYGSGDDLFILVKHSEQS